MLLLAHCLWWLRPYHVIISVISGQNWLSYFLHCINDFYNLCLDLEEWQKSIELNGENENQEYLVKEICICNNSNVKIVMIKEYQ